MYIDIHSGVREIPFIMSLENQIDTLPSFLPISFPQLSFLFRLLSGVTWGLKTKT